MLFKYNGKIYIKPFANKIVEVRVSKRENGYDVEPTNRSVELTKDIENQLISISVEEAAKAKNVFKPTIKKELDDFDI